MTNHNNKISVDMLEGAVTPDLTPVTEIEWHGITVQIEKYLSLEKMLTFVDYVVSSCFASDTGAYMPEIKDFAIRCAILENYANFTLPENTSRTYNIVYGSDVVSTILQHTNQSQFNTVLAAIDEKIENRAQSNIEALTKQMNEVAAGFSALEENFSNVFNGVDDNTVTKIAEAIANGNFDEAKLVRAFTAEPSDGGKVVQMPQTGE